LGGKVQQIKAKSYNAYCRFLFERPFGIKGRIIIKKLKQMKNEPVVSYNHMQDDEMENARNKDLDTVPFSLYMLLAVDAVLISILAVITAKIIF
jgi:hypothetical protein